MSDDTTEAGSLVLVHTLPPVIPDGSWRDEIFSPFTWRSAPSQAGTIPQVPVGEAGGLYVHCDELGSRRAYLKPRRKQRGPFTNRAGREKIAADLAHDLGVRVPPVVLYIRRDAPHGEEELTCLSLVMYPKQWSWELARSYIVDPLRSETCNRIAMSKLPAAAARALALDAWVGQLDHGDHPNNIIFGYPYGAPEQGEFVFLDYSWSLGFGGGIAPYANHPTWADGRWADDLPIAFPPHMRRFLDRTELDHFLGKIEAFDESVLEHIVGRVPQDYIHDAERRIVLEGLVGRKSLVRGWLKADLEARQ